MAEDIEQEQVAALLAGEMWQKSGTSLSAKGAVVPTVSKWKLNQR